MLADRSRSFSMARMPTLFLHIGQAKTGTSSLQRYLHDHPGRLAEAGIAVPPLLAPNHGPFLVAAFGGALDWGRPLERGAGWPMLTARRAELCAALTGYVARRAAEGRDVLVSGEALWRTDEAALGALRAAIRPHVDAIVVLALVRPPAAYARSVAQQLLKVRGAATLEEIAQQPPRAEYARLERFARVFGPDNVRVRLFAPASLADGCILQTVLEMIGGARERLRGERAERINESISATAAKLLSALNQSCRLGRPAPALPAPVATRLAGGPLGRLLATRERHNFAWVLLPAALRQPVLRLAGPRFRLPREAAGRLAAPDADWLAARHGIDVAAADERADDGPPLAESSRFAADEVAEVCRLLDRVARRVEAAPPVCEAERMATLGAQIEATLERLAV